MAGHFETALEVGLAYTQDDDGQRDDDERDGVPISTRSHRLDSGMKPARADDGRHHDRVENRRVRARDLAKRSNQAVAPDGGTGCGLPWGRPGSPRWLVRGWSH